MHAHRLHKTLGLIYVAIFRADRQTAWPINKLYWLTAQPPIWEKKNRWIMRRVGLLVCLLWAGLAWAGCLPPGARARPRSQAQTHSPEPGPGPEPEPSLGPGPKAKPRARARLRHMPRPQASPPLPEKVNKQIYF